MSAVWYHSDRAVFFLRIDYQTVWFLDFCFLDLMHPNLKYSFLNVYKIIETSRYRHLLIYCWLLSLILAVAEVCLFLLFQVTVVLMLNHYSNCYASPKHGVSSLKLGEFLTLNPPGWCISFTVVVLKHSPDFLKTYGLMDNDAPSAVSDQSRASSY